MEETAEDDLRDNLEDSTYDDSGSLGQEGIDDENVITGESSPETEQTTVLVTDPTDTNSLAEHNLVKFSLNYATKSMIYSSLRNLDEFKTLDIEKLHVILTSKEEMTLLTRRHVNGLHDSLKTVCADVPVVCKSWKKKREKSLFYIVSYTMLSLIKH